jgi:7,8-dihydroneopterin aldolase/epimerase/oxygenase
MSKITIADLEVYYCVGVPEEERAKPQRLLITIELEFDFSSAAVSDRIEKTIDYGSIAQDLLTYGEGRSWKLIEKVAANIADRILIQYRPQTVDIEVKKFPIPKAAYVSVSLSKTRRA